MNVNNFFKFIGDKKPEYRLTANNKDLIQTFKNGFEENAQGGYNYDDDTYNFPPLEIEGRGHSDTNGKQGTFLTMVGYIEREQGYGDEPNSYDFSYVERKTQYKNDVKHGKETEFRNTGDVRWVAEYMNGVRQGTKKTYGKKGNLVMVDHYVNDRKKQHDVYYRDTQTVAYTTYYKPNELLNQLTKKVVVNDVVDKDKPTQYYSPSGEKIDYDTLRKKYFNNLDTLGTYY